MLRNSSSTVNTNKLRAKIAERGTTMTEIVKKIRIDPSSMSRKVKGSNDFTVGEMQAIVTELQMTPNEAMDIFLPSISQ